MATELYVVIFATGAYDLHTFHPVTSNPEDVGRRSWLREQVEGGAVRVLHILPSGGVYECNLSGEVELTP